MSCGRPLTSLEMGVHLLLEGSLGDLSPKQHELLVMCREDALRLDRLVKDLLDLSKIESGEARPTPRRESTPVICSSTPSSRCGGRRTRRGCTLHVDAPADLPEIAADRGQVERVITNLVTNAIRATDGRRDDRHHCGVAPRLRRDLGS